jgi:hypothetical protein
VVRDGTVYKRIGERPAKLKDNTLSINLGIGFYQFITYDKANHVEYNQQMEGSWVYLYFGYKSGKAKGLVYSNNEDIINETEFQIDHDYLIDFVELFIGKTYGFIFLYSIVRFPYLMGTLPELP